LKRIVINKCINAINKKKVDLVYPENTVEMNADNEDEADDAGMELDVLRIHRAVEELPDGYRVIFSLYALEGYDHGEISQIMNISESTSKSQYLRAKQKIKEILKEQA
jgi:RNA polymerase sigma-70 factor (ECF subfamily)